MADVYAMMMHIGLSGGILHDLATVADRLTRIHRVTDGIASHFDRWHIALGGVASLLGGAAIIGGVVKLSEGASKWQEALIAAQRSGKDLRDMVKSGELQKLTYDMSKRVGMNIEDLVSIPTTLYSVTGKEEALKLWEPMARYSTLGLTGKSGEDKEKALRALMRAGEQTGRFTDAEGNFDSKRANEFLDLVIKIKAATHGMVNEQTLLNFANRAGPTARSLTDQGFMMEAIQMQAMGGHQAGTSLMSLWQQMAGGTMFKRTAEGMQEMGLLKPGEWHVSGGRVILEKEASKRLTRLIGKDPTDLVTAMTDSMRERGVTEPEDQQREIMRMLNRATTQRMMSEMVMNRRQQRAERERLAGSMGADDSFKLREDDSIKYNMDRLSAAWHNLQMAIAGPNSENFIMILKRLTEVFNDMTQYVRDLDPKKLADLGQSLTVLGVAMTGAGVVALVAAIGPFGWLVGGFAALAAINWDKFKLDWSQMDRFVSFLQKLASILGAIEERSSKVTGQTPLPWVSDKLLDLFGMKPKVDPNLDPNLHPMRFDGGRGGLPSLIPANFDPGEKKQILQPIQLDLNVDGRTLAQCVSEILEDLYQHPSGAPSSNGWNKFRPAGQYSDT